MLTVPITAIILTHNEEKMLPGCLNSLTWVSHLIIVDQQSTDKTVHIAQSAGATVISCTDQSFSHRRGCALPHVHTEWLLYVDADERVTPQLADSIMQLMKRVEENPQKKGVGLVSRKNFYYGKELHHGGWSEPAIPRVFHKNSLLGWSGTIHESPQFKDQPTKLAGELWHLSHRSVIEGLKKSVEWTPLEAHLLYEARIPTVSATTVVRKGLGEIWRRGVMQRGFLDGETGKMEILIQALNRMLVYLQVWELQQQPPLSATYTKLESEITKLWEKR